MMNAVFAFDGVAPTVVGGRAQAALHIFAKADVFLLHFIAEGHGAFDALLWSNSMCARSRAGPFGV